MLSKFLGAQVLARPALLHRIWQGQSQGSSRPAAAFLSSLSHKGHHVPAIVVPVFQQKRFRNRYSGFPKPKKTPKGTILWYLFLGGGIWVLTLTPL